MLLQQRTGTWRTTFNRLQFVRSINWIHSICKVQILGCTSSRRSAATTLTFIYLTEPKRTIFEFYTKRVGFQKKKKSLIFIFEYAGIHYTKWGLCGICSRAQLCLRWIAPGALMKKHILIFNTKPTAKAVC